MKTTNVMSCVHDPESLNIKKNEDGSKNITTHCTKCDEDLPILINYKPTLYLIYKDCGCIHIEMASPKNNLIYCGSCKIPVVITKVEKW